MGDMIDRNAVMEICESHGAAGEAIADEIAALPAVKVGVKPLVWDGWVTCHEATATTGQYVVQDEGDEGWGMWTPEQPEDDHPHSFHPTIDAAKAAAQADYEARILAALEPVALTPTAVDASQTPDPVVKPAPDAAAIREAAPRIIPLHTQSLYGVCIGGRWDGWVMIKHPDGYWVSHSKPDPVDPSIPALLTEKPHDRA